MAAPQPPSVLIIGGGLAGLATARALDSRCRVTLLEQHDRLGGHVDSVSLALADGPARIDLGAQCFAPQTHPTFWQLLRELGFAPDRITADSALVRMRGDMSFLAQGSARPLFVSPVFAERLFPLFRSWNLPGLRSFARFRTAGRRLQRPANEGRTLGEWIDTLPVPAAHRRMLCLALFSGINGTDYAQTRRLALHEGACFFVRNLTANPLKTIVYYLFRNGLAEVIEAIAARLQNTAIQLASPALRVQRTPDGYRVHTASRTYTADHVVLACPPPVSSGLLRDLSDRAALRRTLDRFGYFSSRIVLHTDPCYLPPNPRHWSNYMLEVGERRCESTMWYNHLLGRRAPLFKSWVNDRQRDPKHILADRTYRHPIIDLEFRAAQQALQVQQGIDGLWFAGSYTHDVDSQETALVSAQRVATALLDRLSPTPASSRSIITN